MNTPLSKSSDDAVLENYELFIDGRYVPAQSGRTFETLDPYTLAPWARVPDAGVEDVDLAVAAAQRALQGPWGKMSGFQRAKLIRRLRKMLSPWLAWKCVTPASCIAR